MNPDEPLRTKNLAEEDPAPMDDTLGGYPWLPRMIDKARASHAGMLGEYYRFPCPIDQQCLDLLVVTPATWLDMVASAETPERVLANLHDRGAKLDALSVFDPVAVNQKLHGKRQSSS